MVDAFGTFDEGQDTVDFATTPATEQTAWPESQFGGETPLQAPTAKAEEDWTEEERAMMSSVEERDDQRRRAIFEKQEAETSGKRERKAKAEAELRAWQDQKAKEAEQNKANAGVNEK